MESLMEIQIQSLAFVFGGLRIVSKIPQVRSFKAVINIIRPLYFQWARERSVEMPSREIPPECLYSPSLGQHLYVIINVSGILHGLGI